MGRQHPSPWAQVKQRSASLRRNIERLAQDFVALSGTNGDAITGSNFAQAELDAWRKVLGDVLVSTDNTLRSMQQRAMEQIETLDTRLSRAVREAGFAVYGDAASFFVDGIVHIELDTTKSIVRINGELLSDLSVEQIQSRLLQELERLKKLLTPPEKFLVLVLRAYENEVSQQKKEFGSQIQTGALLWQLTLLKQQPTFRSNPTAENFRPYPREVFRADFFRLLEANVTLAKGKQFRYASGSDTDGAIFTLVPQLGRPAHVGRIWFE